jgi:hypothetical protein
MKNIQVIDGVTNCTFSLFQATDVYQLQRYKKMYREKREDAVEQSAINAAQRRLFDIR